jgi:hypothetical protein
VLGTVAAVALIAGLIYEVEFYNAEGFLPAAVAAAEGLPPAVVAAPVQLTVGDTIYPVALLFIVEIADPAFIMLFAPCWL